MNATRMGRLIEVRLKLCNVSRVVRVEVSIPEIW